ncbi:MAG: biotin/lipoyl-containing protein [Bacteroidota bacterium]|nr:biotin/lipoyl-containing protein [Bacteroidota bacterium]
MKKFKFTIRGTAYHTEIKKIEEDIAYMEVNGTEYKVKIDAEVQKTKTPKLVRSKVSVNPDDAEIKKAKPKVSVLNAPLPGVIIKIEVNEGDEVKAGDTLLIMEAMKMENNIQAEKSGKVKSIKVKEGQNVMQNELLIEME